MRLTNLARSRVFRLTLASALLFSGAVVGLVALLYLSGRDAVSRQIDATIEAEIKGLAEQYSQQGTFGLIDVINHRSSTAGHSGGIYLLANPQRQRLAGNIDRWPDAKPDKDGWIRFALTYGDEPDRGTTHYARARVLRVPGGLWLLVGHDTREQSRIEAQMERTLIWAGIIAVLLAVASGALLSWLILRRIDTVTTTSHEIMAGDLSRRIPLAGTADEFERLAASLNAMLDQNERLFRGLQEVAENIAHDLRSPLGRLRSRLETILAGDMDERARRDATRDAIAEADRLLRTFSAILSIAQAESGAPKRNFGPVDLAVLVADLADLYGPLAEDAGLTLSADARPGAPVMVRGDRDMLFQACVNLVDNAIKYAAAGKRIDIVLRVNAGRAAIEVRDHGPGVPEEARRKVMDRFVRLDESRTSDGVGLGLSLADAVARLHDGALALEDNAPGLAAILTLPLDKSPPPDDKPSPGGAMAGTGEEATDKR